MPISIYTTGGETIRQLIDESGAHIEISRHAHPPGEKVFIIKGAPEARQMAIELINKKIQVCWGINYCRARVGNWGIYCVKAEALAMALTVLAPAMEGSL